MFYGDSCYMPLHYTLNRKTILLNCSPGSRSTETEETGQQVSEWVASLTLKHPRKTSWVKERSFWIGYFLYIINKNRDKSAFYETVLWQLGYAQLLDPERALVFNAKSAKTPGWRYRQSLYRISRSTIWNRSHWTAVQDRVKAKKQVGLKCRKLNCYCSLFTFQSAWFIGGLLYQYACCTSTLLLKFWVPQSVIKLVYPFLMMKAHDIMDTSATHAKNVHYEPDCQTQKGSTHGHVFLTFKHRFQRN